MSILCAVFAELLRNTDCLDWSDHKRPIVLLNAVRAVEFHPESLDSISFIMGKLESVGISFVCDDVMEQVIKFGMYSICGKWR